MPRRRSLSRRGIGAARVPLAIVLACFVWRPVDAAERFWITPTGGGFGTPGVPDVDWSNTDGGAGGALTPGVADVANFTLNNTYDVTFSSAVTNTDLDIENGNVTFDLEGLTYTGTSVLAIEVGKVLGQTGRLTVLDGIMTVDTASDNIQVGNTNDSTGFLTVGTGGQVGTSGTRPLLVIGNSGTGTLTIQNDGQLFTTAFYVGNNEGSSGTVTVTGPQATLNVSSTIIVANDGTGTMTVSSGADIVSSSATTIADGIGTTGTVTITGASSNWTQTSGITVGNNGVGTLNVQSGGSLSTSAGTIGSGSGSFGTANISGAGSTWTLTNPLTVGNNGEGVINVTSGGQVSIQNAFWWSIGVNATSQGTATVSGAGSRVDVANDLFLGSAGIGTLTISSGGQVTSDDGFIAASAGTGVGDVTITGAGSSWTTIGSVTVATVGTGTITVENGGALNMGNTLSLSDPAGAPVGTLNFHGGTIAAGSFSRDVGAVLNWTDGTLTLDDGAFDNFGAAFTLNGGDADDRPTLRLTNGSTTLVAQMGALTVGNDRAATLEVTGGSILQVPSISIGALDGGDGIVTVGGNNSSLAATTSNINVGGTGSAGGGTGTLNVETGATVTTAIAGQLRLWAGGTVNVNGGTLFYGSLTANGGHVNFNAGRIEQYNGLTADEATLTALLGTSHALGAGRTLAAGGGTATVSANLDLNGGQLVGNILGLASIGLGATILNIRGGGVAQFNNGATLGAGTRTFIDDGTLHAGTTLTQQGELFLSSTSRVTAATLLNTGLVSGSGRIDADLDNELLGQVRVATGQRLVLGGTPNFNDGLIDVSGGELEVVAGSTFTNSTAGPSTGLITARNATLRFGSGLTNSGALTFTSGVSEVYGDITNTNILPTPGRVIVSGGAQVNFYDDITNNGLIQVSAAGSLASTAVFLGSLSGNGVSGGGHVFNEGDMRPGFSPGTMAFGGDLSFGPLAALEIELAGIAPGTQFDRVTVAEALTLGGALEVSLLGGFAPAAGNSFDILDWGALNGTFDTIDLPALAGGLTWDTSQLYASGVLAVAAPVLPGDYNDDGIVDAADYVVWRKNEGTTNTLPNDPIGGIIGPAQFDQWRANFGQTAGGGSNVHSLREGSVPEPAGLVLIMVGSIMGLAVKRR
jgi:T5SS/PEP-CTERM-associated repeat protein